MSGRFLGARLVRYGIVGIFSTGVHISAAFLFLYFVNQSLFFSNLFGFSWAYLFSYFFQSKFVFESHISPIKALKYLLVQLLSLLLAMGCSNAAAEFNIYLKVLLTAVILPLITFAVHKLWTFADDARSGTEI